jgi:hypothetical protein
MSSCCWRGHSQSEVAYVLDKMCDSAAKEVIQGFIGVNVEVDKVAGAAMIGHCLELYNGRDGRSSRDNRLQAICPSSAKACLKSMAPFGQVEVSAVSRHAKPYTNTL